MKSFLKKVVEGEPLSRSEAKQAMEKMINGNVPQTQIASFLTAMRMKGETVEELIGFVEGIHSQAIPVRNPFEEAVDTCGTGGDGQNTFNISTAASIVASAAGVPVIKHGNRAVSGKSGSADVLEALKMNIRLNADEAVKMLEKTRLCFLFAPLFHPAVKKVMSIRKELGFRTCFNLMGPLLNPARVKVQLLGVYDAGLTGKVAHVLKHLGIKRALVVSGLDGLDEMTVTDATRISELENGKVKTYEVTPESLGVTRWHAAGLRGGSAEENARIMNEVFAGKEGAPADIVSINAGAVLYLAGKAGSLKEGTEQAKRIIQSGRAREQLNKVVQASKEVTYVS
jgi:anthranilate phosphoribosyltransferase